MLAAQHGGHGPQQRREQRHGQRQACQHGHGGAGHERHRLEHEREHVRLEAPAGHFAVLDQRLQPPLAMLLLPQERFDFAVHTAFAGEIQCDAAVGQRFDAQWAQHLQQRQKSGILAARIAVRPRHQLGMCLGCRFIDGRFDRRACVRQVAVGKRIEQPVAQPFSLPVVAAGIDGDVQADAVVREQRQVGVEQQRVAAVADGPVAVDVLLVEAQTDAGQVRQAARDLRVHQLHRFRFQDLRIAQLPLPQVGQHEAAHVRAGRRQAAGRRHVDDLEALGRLLDAVVALRHLRRQRRRQRLAEGRALHAQRREDVLFDVVVERLAADAFDDVAGQRRRIIRIALRGAGIVDVRRHVAFQYLAQVGRGRTVGDQVARRFFQARGVRHRVAQRQRLAVARRDLEVDVAIQVGVQVQLALFDQLHHGRPRKQFRDGARPEQRARRIDGNILVPVGVAITLLHQRLAILDQHHDGAGHARGAQCAGHHTVQPDFGIGRGQRGSALGRGRQHGGSAQRQRGARQQFNDSDGAHQKFTARLMPPVRGAAGVARSGPPNAVNAVSAPSSARLSVRLRMKADSCQAPNSMPHCASTIV